MIHSYPLVKREFRVKSLESRVGVKDMRPDWKEVPRGDGVAAQFSGMYVTLNRKGMIAMSRVTYDRMGAPKAFQVLFDVVNNRIGLKPAALTTRNAYPVRVHSTSGGKKLNVFRMMQEFRVSLPHTVRFYDAETDEDGILILDLRTASVSPKAVGWKKRRNEN